MAGLVLLFAVVLAAGCGKPAPTGAPPVARPAGVVPCFPDDGPVAFTVNGVDVPEKTVTRLAAFLRELQPAMTDELAQGQAIDQTIIPTAAAYAAAGPKIPDWSKKVLDVTERLKKGADFAATAKAESACPSKEKGGDLGAFTRDRMVVPFAAACFASSVGTLAEPVVTVFGAHVFKVTEKTDGSSAGQDQRRVSHVLIAFDADALKDGPGYQKLVDTLKHGARVEVKKDSYKKLIPAAYRR